MSLKPNTSPVLFLCANNGPAILWCHFFDYPLRIQVIVTSDPYISISTSGLALCARAVVYKSAQQVLSAGGPGTKPKEGSLVVDTIPVVLCAKK